MKILHFTTFLVLFIFSLNSQAQYTWEEIVIPDTVGVKMIAFDSIGNQFIASDKGVYYSENDYDWEQTGLSDYESYICINENNTIYAGMEYLYRSFDNGITWDSIFHSPEGGIMSVRTNGDSNVFIGTWGGIFRSIDSGQTWSHVLDTYNSEVFNAIINNSDDTLFAGSSSFSGSGSAGGIYRSDNNGETWLLSGLEYHYISSIVINTTDEIYVGTKGQYYTGASGVFKSYDNGVSWDTIYENNLVASMDKNDFDDIAIGCDSQEGDSGGIFVSYDGGENWEDITNNLTTKAFDQVLFSPDNYLYTVTHFGGRLFRTDTPVSISEMPNQHTYDPIQVFPNPVSDRLTIIFKENFNHKNADIKIFNTLGTEVKQVPLSQNVKEILVDISKLESGLYFVVMKAEGIDMATGRFLVVR